MSLVVEAIGEYSQENENIFRQEVRKRLDRTWKRNAHVVIPYGYHLGFQAANGTEYIFSVDEDDNLAFGAAEDTPISLASVSLVVSVSADVATLTAEVVAARDGEASLNARITTVHTAATSAGTAAATAQSEITAARDGESSLLAKVNSIDSAIVSEAGARASADTAITAAYQAADTSLQASITTNATAITNEASARASADTAITAAYQAADATLTASVSTNASAIATVDGKLSASYALTVSAGKIAQLKLLADGTTSTIAFTATSFKIFDDSSTDVSPFEVTGGQVKIKTANVGVLTAANISVANLAALSADLGNITAGQIRLTSGGYAVHIDAGFGVSSDLVLWYGPSSTAAGSATKTNGVLALATDGKVYLGTTELTAAANVLTAIPSAEIATGSGNQSTVEQTASITLSISGGTAPYSVYWRSLGDKVFETGVLGAFTIDDNTGTTVYWEAEIDPSGEFTSDTWQARITDDDGRITYAEVILQLTNEDWVP